jgi:hypothetical protein
LISTRRVLAGHRNVARLALIATATVLLLTACGRERLENESPTQTAEALSAHRASTVELDRYSRAPERPCGSRAEASGPDAAPEPGPTPGAVVVDDIAYFRGPSGFPGRRRALVPGGKRYFEVKMLLVVRAGLRATLVVPVRYRDRLGLQYTQLRPEPTGNFTVRSGAVAVRFVGCRAADRAREYQGAIGPWTAFNGSLLVTRRGCYEVDLYDQATRRVYRPALPLGVSACTPQA